MVIIAFGPLMKVLQCKKSVYSAKHVHFIMKKSQGSQCVCHVPTALVN